MPRRIQYHGYGGPERMRLETFTPAAPGKGEVLIRVRAAAANAVDWKIRNGEMAIMTGRRFPRGIGQDFAGVVEQAGADVTGFRAGDEVLGGTGLRTAGAFAEVVVADAAHLAVKPAGLSFTQAASLPTAGVTALQALAGLEAGQSVFINGCLGGVGRIAVQLALHRGLAVSGSCRAAGRAEAERLGVSPVVDAGSDEVPGRFDLVFDTAGTLPGRTARALLNRGGRIIDINGSPAKMLRSALPGPYRMQFTRADARDLAAVAQAVAEGRIEVPIARVVPLDAAIEALTDLELRHSPKGGKLVVAVD